MPSQLRQDRRGDVCELVGYVSEQAGVRGIQDTLLRLVVWALENSLMPRCNIFCLAL
jgi:hypothetical protein